jgi:hypothetical protein
MPPSMIPNREKWLMPDLNFLGESLEGYHDGPIFASTSCLHHDNTK